MNIRRVFNVFDNDESGALDLSEMVEMFHNFGINVDPKKIKLIFEIVDETKDDALNYQEFKSCIFSPQVNQLFSEIMNEVAANQEHLPEEQRAVYLPRTFYAMITYLSYRVSRGNKLK